MATSTEQITDLINGYTDLKAYFEDWRGGMERAKNNLIDFVFTTIYVDETSGLPGNDGSLEAPFATLDDAIESLDAGQGADIRLLSNVTWSRRQWRVQSFIRLTGWNAATGNTFTRTVTFADVAENSTGQVPGITGTGFCGVRFTDLDVVLSGGAIDGAHFSSGGFMAVAFRNSSLSGTVGVSSVAYNYMGPFSLGANNLTYTDMAGRWVSGVAAGAPLSADTIGGIVDAAIIN